MPIDLTTKFLPYVDEMFYKESKKSLLTNQDFQWDGAHAVKVYKEMCIRDRCNSNKKGGQYAAQGVQ